MNLVRLTYTSVEADRVSNADLDEIIGISHHNNDRDALTGVLLYNRPYFIRILEGKREVVGGLLERLYRDPRHTSLRIVSFREVDTREFSRWSMRLIRLDEMRSDAVKEVCLKHGIDLPLRLPQLREAQLSGWLRDLNDLANVGVTIHPGDEVRPASRTHPKRAASPATVPHDTTTPPRSAPKPPDAIQRQSSPPSTHRGSDSSIC